MIIIFIDSQIVKQQYISWINSPWSWCIIIFYVVPDFVYNYYINIYLSVLMGNIDLKLYFMLSLSSFVSG